MALSFQHTEGIILRVIPFRDYDQILTLFTLDAGLIKLLHKGGRYKKRGLQGLYTPLTKVEVIYREKESEIFSCQEMTLIDPLSYLRNKFVYLEVAGDFIQAIFVSQLIGKAAPQLYTLLCFYLHKISQIQDPWILALSFRLKLMKYEGLMIFPFSCNRCQKLLLTVGYEQGTEWWCQEHQRPGSLSWYREELELIYRLANCHKYQEICFDRATLAFRHKLFMLFEACIRR